MVYKLELKKETALLPGSISNCQSSIVLVVQYEGTTASVHLSLEDSKSLIVYPVLNDLPNSY